MVLICSRTFCYKVHFMIELASELNSDTVILQSVQLSTVNAWRHSQVPIYYTDSAHGELIDSTFFCFT